jgi:uncharacterized iron-regulated membrane protein
MRRYHRWVAVVFGIFILWIAATGAITQGARLYASGEKARNAAAGIVTPPVAEAPRPPQSPARQFVHFITDLHSGERFGVAGQLISLVSGLALLFFAFSGLWMYVQMFRARSRRERAEHPVFWK